jgi:hypothetical protein
VLGADSWGALTSGINDHQEWVPLSRIWQPDFAAATRNGVWTRLRLRLGFGLVSGFDSVPISTRLRFRLGYGCDLVPVSTRFWFRFRLGYDFDSNGHDFCRFPAKIVIDGDGCAEKTNLSDQSDSLLLS